MTYLLDTNVCVHALRKKGSALVKQRLGTHPPNEIALCSLVTAELRFGAERSGNSAQEHARLDPFVAQFTSLPFDDAAALVYGRIRHDLETRGIVIGANDLLIAAIALANGLVLVTHNTSEFGRVPNLVLEDWELP